MERHRCVCSGEVRCWSCADVLTSFTSHSLASHILYASVCTKLEHSSGLWAFIADCGERLQAAPKCCMLMRIPVHATTIQGAHKIVRVWVSSVRHRLLYLELGLGIDILLLLILACRFGAISRREVWALGAVSIGANPASIVSLRVISPTAEHRPITILVASLYILAIIEKTSWMTGSRRLRVLLDRLEVRSALKVRLPAK